MRYLSSLPGPSISVADTSISQGAYVAVERAEVFNTGGTVTRAFVLSTTGAEATALYCYALFGPNSTAALTSTCPPTSSDPGSISIEFSLPPGQGVLVVVTMIGANFVLGSAQTLTVTCSSGAQQTAAVEVVPA